MKSLNNYIPETFRKFVKSNKSKCLKSPPPLLLLLLQIPLQNVAIEVAGNLSIVARVFVVRIAN